MVSQRPAELDATIISQCSTLFAMRMTNDRDQAIVRAAVSDGASNLLDFLPSLGTGEVFAFGEGVALPARVKLKQLPSELLPKSEAMSGASSTAAVMSEDFLPSVLKRWRSATTAHQPDTEDMQHEPRLTDGDPPLQPASAAEPARLNVRKGQLGEPFDIAGAFPGEAPARLPHD